VDINILLIASVPRSMLCITIPRSSMLSTVQKNKHFKCQMFEDLKFSFVEKCGNVYLSKKLCFMRELGEY